jgi:hypothetical protein
VSFPSFKTLVFLAVLALVVAFVAKSPAKADLTAHHLMHGAAQLSDSFSKFVGGL